MRNKRHYQLIFLSSLVIVLSLLCVPSHGATSISGIVTPPSDLGSYDMAATLTLTYSATITDADDSMAVVIVTYPTGKFSYQSFSATMDSTDVSAQFTVTDTSGSLKVECSDTTPANGVLTIEIEFLIVGPSGDYSTGWEYYFTAFPPPPSTPILEKDNGSSNIHITTFVIPELPLGPAMSILASLAGLYIWKRRN